jgi:hypothetical protein
MQPAAAPQIHRRIVYVCFLFLRKNEAVPAQQLKHAAARSNKFSIAKAFRYLLSIGMNLP